jgi:hypothetical protein
MPGFTVNSRIGLSLEPQMPLGQEETFMAIKVVCALILALGLTSFVGCKARDTEATARPDSSDSAVKVADRSPAEARSAESKAVDPAVQSDIEKMHAEKRATLHKDAQSAIEDTRNALAALDKGDQQAALAALQQATGKLDLVVSRDPKLALAPVSVTTTMLDLYATPDTVKAVVKQAKDHLGAERVQDARLLISDLASEADIHVTEIPLASYPATIRAVVPLVDAGKIDEAKAALHATLSTLVIETYVIPLPKVRAEAMLNEADTIANKSNRTDDDKAKLRAMIDATRRELQLAEVLGYGTKDSYKPLYAQLDDIQKKTEGGQSGRGLFDKLRNSLREFRFTHPRDTSHTG